MGDNKSRKDVVVFGLIFKLFIVIALTYLIVGQMVLPTESPCWEGECSEFDTQWYVELKNGQLEEVSVPGSWEAKRKEPVTLVTTLPENLSYGKILCFRSSRQDMEIYIDGVLRVEYSTEDTRLFGHSSASVYQFVELTPTDSGKQLKWVLTTDSTYAGVIRTVYIGNVWGIWHMFADENGLEFIIAFLTVFLGLGSIIVSATLKRLYKSPVHLEYLGWGTILAASWILFDSEYRQLLFHNVTIINEMAFVVIMLLPFPFLAYMDGTQKRRYHKWYVLAQLLCVLSVICCSFLQVANIVDFTDSVFAIFIVCGFAVGMIFLTIFKDLQKGHLQEYKIIAVGIFAACLAAVGQMILYIQRVIPFNGSIIALGLIVLLLLAAINTVQDLIKMEREKRMAIQASKSKAQFLANMSHEIRTPINAVLGMDELILRECTDSNIREYAKDIQNAGRNLLALINDILDFSKIESGKMDIVPVEYSLSSLLNDCFNLINLKAVEKHLDFRVKNDESLPNLLEGDEARIRQVVINLLTNAVKYTAEGGVVLTASGEYVADDRLLLRITVTDTGMGIKLADQLKLFDSFQRVDEEKNRNIEGTGLGLTICKQLVSLMGGTISVNSTYGEGSTFQVVIPQIVKDKTPIGRLSDRYTEESQEEHIYVPQFWAPQAKILVVDDVSMNLKVFQGLLKGTGVQIDMVTSGKACLGMAVKEKYDIIFLDHMMPDMDGVETLHELERLEENLNHNTPVIMLTANAILGAKEEYMQEGFADYLSKPVRGNDLEEMIKKYLSRELITSQEESEETHTEALDEQTNPWEVLEGIHEVDVATGLLYCAENKELYLEILDEYVNGNHYDEIQQYYEEEDWKNYEIRVHGLKSTSLSIGAKELSEKALDLEMAAQENKISHIKEAHDSLMQDYKTLLGKLQRVIDGVNHP